MDKRYQVFVSSTFSDLKEERQSVIRAVMELDCIPAGMELFPAADEEQFEFIKRVIDDCDYYLLIIGGRYGSLTEEGISFTEQEYDYAVSRGLRVIALLPENPDDIAFGKSEKDPALQEKLQLFKAKVSAGRLVKFWKGASDLPGKVALSLSQTMKMHPAVGWVRADKVASEDILTEINELRKRNADLVKSIDSLQPQSPIKDLAGLDEAVTILGRNTSRGFSYNNELKTTWGSIFANIAPYLMKSTHDWEVKSILAKSLFAAAKLTVDEPNLEDQSFQTIGIQLQALGLVDLTSIDTMGGSLGMLWRLTPAGARRMVELRAVRTSKAPTS